LVGERKHMQRIAADPEREVLENPPAGEATSVRSADGTTLHVETFGTPDGQTVVLVHGWTEMLTFWTYVIRTLTDAGMRVVAYDLRGHGHSEPAAAGEYKLARFGEDLEAVLNACLDDGQRAVVAGHSLGAMSIAAWAQGHEVDRNVRAAALVNTGVGNLIAEQLLIPVPPIARAVSQTVAIRGFMGARAPLPHYTTPLSYALVRYTAFSREASPALVAFFERMLWTCPPRVRADIGIAMSEMDLFDALTRLTVPTSVIAGADDRLTPPSHARRIGEMLPDLRELVVLPSMAHMAPLERPDDVSRVILGLVSDPTASPAESAAGTGRRS
jgi:pimeloyl-ACP methyl ester carboxylesterase